MTNTRRTFVWKFGAGASAAIASVVGLAPKAKAASADNPEAQELALRKFHQRFEQKMSLDMFADDAEVVFNGGIFKNRNGGVRRFFSVTGRRMDPAPGFELTAEQQMDCVELSPDLRTATAVFPFSIQVGRPFETESSLAAMARLHGEGVRTWWEGGIYRIHYKKDAAGLWKIHRLEYDTLSRADYRSGKRYALPISVPRFAVRFPADPHGPDELV